MITALTYQNTAGTIEVRIRRVHHKRWYLQMFRKTPLVVSSGFGDEHPAFQWTEITNRECKSLTEAQARARAAVR